MTPLPGLRWITGFSLNRYTVSNEGTPREDTVGKYARYWAAVPDHGLKVGLRVGAIYHLDRHWSVELLTQVTELGRSPEAVAGRLLPSAVKGPTNPAWLQLGVSWHF